MTQTTLLRSTKLTLGVLAFFFIAQQLPWLRFFHLPFGNTPFYLAFFILGILGPFLIWKRTLGQTLPFIRESLLFFFPVALFFAFGLFFSDQFHVLVSLSVGIFTITVFGYFVGTVMKKEEKENALPVLSEKSSRGALFSVLLLTLLFFLFGLFHLTKFAAVDEPLWMDGRISRFWKNLAELDLEKTNVSDKPGITVAIASGPGLLFVTPKDYRDARFMFSAKNENLQIEDFYLAFRLPLLLVITLFLPFFYFFLVPLLGTWKALLGYTMVVLSPILIGMSKIVNPDSLLWVFAPLSFLAYLVFLEKKYFRFLLLSGVFLGLALLTKYVANFLVVFFFGFIVLHLLFAESKLAPGLALKKAFSGFLVWLGTGLSVFYLLLPSVWLEPETLFTSTIFSQAFEKVAPFFLGLIVLLLIDQYGFQARFSTLLLEYLKRFRVWIGRFFVGLFLLITVFVVVNGMFGMPWTPFMEILSSPKSIYQVSDLLNIFLTNFYPLLFGVPTLLLLGALGAVLLTLKQGIHTTEKRVVLAIVVFILLYALASTVNKVVLINRYQIMLYPLFGILAALGWGMILLALKEKVTLFTSWRPFQTVSVVLFAAALGLILWTTPFPLSFSSALLPKAYTTDIKDMGSGSYEAAQYLNSLPEARKLAIWTDKRGVCKFFVGTCTDGFDFEAIPSTELDYVVISAGRERRTERMMANPYLLNDEGLIRFDTYYEKENPEWELFINGRPGQFVKIFPFDPHP